MFTIEGFGSFLKYNNWANECLIQAAGALTDVLLDQPVDMGRGSLRLTLMHIWAGEHVWLQRWKGMAETPWPSEEEALAPAAIGARLQKVHVECSLFVSWLKAGDLVREIPYRDSKGSLFRANLSDMMTQGVVHSVHHRAQGANMIRRAGGGVVELDFMYWARNPIGD